MSNNGAEHLNGQGGPKENDLFARPGKPAPRRATPEEGCFTMVGGMLLLLVSIAFWGWYYWQHNPEFHPERPQPNTRATPKPREVRQLNPSPIPK